MPRGRCHFALLFRLVERFRSELPAAAVLARRSLPDLVAGCVAPDGLRFVGDAGKLGTHFYAEDRQELWGLAVAGLFRAHPELADPTPMEERDRALLVGYISHLTVDEAFRDTVTYQVHGIPDWRPIIQGLWSLVDEMPVGHPDLAGQIDRFRRHDRVGFIDCGHIRKYLDLTALWARQSDPWEVERLFLELTRQVGPEDEARERWQANRRRAGVYLDEERWDGFVAEALRRGLEETRKYLNGEYRS